MAINPCRYDVEELRDLAEARHSRRRSVLGGDVADVADVADVTFDGAAIGGPALGGPALDGPAAGGTTTKEPRTSLLDRPSVGGHARRRPRPDEALRAAQYERLLARDLVDGPAERPYLTALPASHDGVLTIFEWLEHLLARGGVAGTLATLEHYRSLDWFTPAVGDHLRRYLRGLPAARPALVEPSSMAPADHRLSLVYVARLASMAD